MNALDFAVTVTPGSILANFVLSKKVTPLEGAVAFIQLVAQQHAITWAIVRFDAEERVVRSELSSLQHEGTSLNAVMRRERVTEEEFDADIRECGAADRIRASSVVFETDVSFSVITER